MVTRTFALFPRQVGTVPVALLTAAALPFLATVAGHAEGFDPAAAGRPAMRAFQDRDGLPQNTIHAITFDVHGRLWIGTQDGAAVSAGRGWEVVDMPGRMESNFVRAILSASDGSLWFGTHTGRLHRQVEGRWEEVSAPCLSHPAQQINALLETRSPPAIWAAIHGCGVARLAGGRWEVFTRREGLPSERVWGLHASPGDGTSPESVWAGTEAGVAVLPAGSARFVADPGLSRVSANAFLERSTPDGNELWIGTYGSGVYRRRAGTWRAFTEKDGLPSPFVTSLASHGWPDPVWVGTDGGGLASISLDDAIRTLGIDSGLVSNAVYSLVASGPERGGKALWIGTRAGGLVRMMSGRWSSFLPAAEGTSAPITAVLVDPGEGDSTAVWFGMDGGGVARLDRQGWTRFTATSGELPSDSVQCLLAIHDGGRGWTLWIGTRHGGLVRFSLGRWQTFDHRTGALPNDMVQSLMETEGDDGVREVWVGTRGGLARFKAGRWLGPPAGVLLPQPSVQVLLETREGPEGRVIWIGTAGGLIRYAGSASSPVRVRLRNHSVQSLGVVAAPGGRRQLWIGTDGGGVSRLDLSDKPQEIPNLDDQSSPPLPNNVVYQILQDRKGDVYLLTNRGVARLSWRSDQQDSLEVHTFTADDGLASNQGNRGAGVVDWRGRIWVGLGGGASLYDPTVREKDSTSKPLRLHVFSAGGKVAIRSGQRLPWRRAQLTLEASLMSHFREGDTRYRTQLLPVERQPSEWGRAFTREVGPLAPGKYTFRVWGRDWAGNVTGPEEFAFRIVPPPWRSWWAMVLYVLLAVGAVAAVVAVRMRAHHRRERALEALIAARTRELSDANELLREMSYLDPVTEIANRRRFDERLGQEWRRAVRAGSPLSLIMVDIDCFKEFNDTFGHQRGDECLHTIAHALADGLPRAGDSVARYGGEEFAVILPSTEHAGAVKLAEALRRRVEFLAIAHPTSSAAPVVTISCGVATLSPTADMEAGELVRLADQSLYLAKHGGRNRVTAEQGRPTSGLDHVAVPPLPS